MFHIYGIDPSKFQNNFSSALKLIHPDDQYKLKDAMELHLKGLPCEIEFRILQKNGEIKYVVGKGEPILNDQQKVIGIIGTLQDITEKKLLEEKLEREQAKINEILKRFQVLVQESSDVFEILSPDGTIKYISEASEGVIGFKPEERVGKKVFEYYEKEDQLKLREMMNSVLQKPYRKAQGDVIIKTKDGNEIYLEVHMQNLMHEPIIDGIVVNFRDITKRVEMEKQIVHISTHDELTGLPNRTYFKSKLESQWKYAKSTNTRFAVMMLDIDGFKYINDALGYVLGDKLIIGITDRLKSFFGNEDFICRYSADRFGVILHSLNTIEEYEIIAKSVVGLFDQTFRIDKYELEVTICIGISFNQEEHETDILLNQAEIALFWAKKSGKNRYKFYSSDINIQNYKQFELRNDLRKALEGNEFCVHYQPIVRLKNSEILAAEALIRWEHPSWGIVSPSEFITLAEEIDLITNIGNWLLREVCCNYKQWLKKGLPKIKIAINFSSVQFFENNFIEKIIDTIKEFDLDPHFLIMEITESILMVRQDRVLASIKNLQSYGIQIAIDDFGTGYSSLAYLNSFSIDILKLDGSFIRNSVIDKTSSIITKTVINMARELKIKLVAEGIENWQQLLYLKEHNCYTGQGYLYSKPLPLEGFEKVLAKKKCKPLFTKNTAMPSYDNRRKFFRVELPLLLEADLTILEIKGKKINIGNTKVLVKDIGPGGLCFISNIKLPVEKDVILQFISQLVGKEVRFSGYSVWAEEVDKNLFEYGVQFTFDENERTALIRILNTVQVKMRKDILFAEGSFVSVSPIVYFKSHTN